MTATMTRPTTKTRRPMRLNKSVLLDELRHAYDRKGSALTTVDADRRRYGLRYKNAYIHAFGTWNNAIESAGLPVNQWKGGRTKGTPNSRPSRPAQRYGHDGELIEMSALEQHIQEKLQREREEVHVLERMLGEVSHLRRVTTTS